MSFRVNKSSPESPPTAVIMPATFSERPGWSRPHPGQGYLVGFEVVSRMGERRSLAELSRLSGEGLRQEIVGTLGELAGTAICTR